MDFFDTLYNPTWKTLSADTKHLVMEQIIRYFINPMIQIQDVHPVRFEMGGIKTDTYEMTLNGRAFVFVPGQKEACLGWDLGVEGFTQSDIDPERVEMTLAVNNFISDHLNQYQVSGQAVPSIFEIGQSDRWHTMIETLTPIRRKDIGPMIVEKKARLVGVEDYGYYSIINGSLFQDSELSERLLNPILLKEIQDAIDEVILNNDAEAWQIAYPRSITHKDKFTLFLDDSAESYQIKMPFQTNLKDTMKEESRFGMGLLSSDEWEYACGGSSRRLFRWGKDVKRDYFEKASSPILAPNMFGLEIATGIMGPELVEDGNYVKGGWITQDKDYLLGILTLSSYYFNHQDSLLNQMEAQLTSAYYCVRQSIRLTMD